MEKHEWIELLKSDVHTFNAAYQKWRNENPGKRLDLTRANLTGANLRYANLMYANLTDANLMYANLTDANLRYANLRYANLTGANLRYANLRYANLTDANLTDADLTGANLTDANLWHTDGIIRVTGHDRRGWELFVITWEDGPRIKAGCRWFTLDEALSHWGGDDYPDRERGQRYVDTIKLVASWLPEGE